MKHLLSIAVVFLLISTGCGSDNSAEIINAPSVEQSELNIGSGFVPKILPPSPGGPTVIVVALPETLFSAVGTIQTAIFSGSVSDFDTAWYTLTDEYGETSLSGSITTALFTITQPLSAIANANDTDGRKYIFTVTAVGTFTVSASDTIVVPYIPVNNDDDDDDGDDDDDEDDDSCRNGHHGKSDHKKHWKCEKCGKHNHSSIGNHWKCKKCDWNHDKEWKCKKCGRHHDRNGNKDNCKKKGKDDKGG